MTRFVASGLGLHGLPMSHKKDARIKWVKPFPYLTQMSMEVVQQLFLKCNVKMYDQDNIQMMHSFEVDIRICQAENSDVHRGETEVNFTFEG